MTKRYKDRMKPSVCGVGFVGNGDYKTAINYKVTPSYIRWKNMLKRCYSEASLKRQPTYKGCTVCEEWLDFQVFSKWFYDNYPKDGKPYELDKDIKVSGNKVYSPESCVFVTKEDNLSGCNNEIGAKRKIKSPLGVVYEFTNQKEFAKKHGLNSGHISSVLNGNRVKHKGWYAV